MRCRWLWAVVFVAPTMVAAQTSVVEPSAVLGCLTPSREQRGTPEYPFDEWKFKKTGRVQVELQFNDPDIEPSVRVVREEGGDAFVEAVKAHVRQFRAPCLGKAATARLLFDFVFHPDLPGVPYTEPVDPDHDARKQSLTCLRHESGKRAPAYPEAARRKGIDGRVLVELLFDAPDKPPVAKVYSSLGQGPLHDAIETWVKGFRMPCVADTPLVVKDIYVYRLDGDPAYGFKDITLLQYLRAVKDIRKQRLDFDFTTMGCPFRVRLIYLQPHRANDVFQLDNYNAARQPFVDWLQTTQLDVSKEVINAVYADELTLKIPCTKFNLNPQEQ